MAVEACGAPITLDVAAADWNHKCERYFTEGIDGLKQDWDAKAVWCNPPYKATIIEAFVRKALDAFQCGTTSVFLIPWWNYPYMDLCERYGRVHRICSPVCFRREDGSTFAMNNRYGTTQLVVVVFGPTIQPGNGIPIRNGGTPDDADAEVTESPATPPPAERKSRDTNDADLQNTETPPSLCQWIFERLVEADVRPKTVLDPCAGRGHLTRPFGSGVEVIDYEITLDRDFFEAKKVACDLVICNPPWQDALRWLQKIVEVAGSQTPIVFICPVLFFIGYKTAPCRQYLESPTAPVLNHITPLPSDTFVKVYCPGAILWMNLPEVQNVGLVPSTYLIRSNEPRGTASWPAVARTMNATVCE
jgi:hypothetical protein